MQMARTADPGRQGMIRKARLQSTDCIDGLRNGRKYMLGGVFRSPDSGRPGFPRHPLDEAGSQSWDPVSHQIARKMSEVALPHADEVREWKPALGLSQGDQTTRQPVADRVGRDGGSRPCRRRLCAGPKRDLAPPRRRELAWRGRTRLRRGPQRHSLPGRIIGGQQQGQRPPATNFGITRLLYRSKTGKTPLAQRLAGFLRLRYRPD